MGFEDRTTFMVTNRSFSGIPITKQGSTLKTAAWDVEVTPSDAAPGAAPHIVVTSPSGAVLYDSATDHPTPARPDGPVPSLCAGLPEPNCTEPGLSPRVPAHWVCLWEDGECRELNQQTKPNLLHWPSPLTARAYRLVDYPRFFVPAWDLMPAPKTVQPELKATNGCESHTVARVAARVAAMNSHGATRSTRV